MGYQMEFRVSSHVGCDCCPNRTPSIKGGIPDKPVKLDRLAKKNGYIELREHSLSNKGNVCWRSWTEYHICPDCQKKGRGFEQIKQRAQAAYRRREAKKRRQHRDELRRIHLSVPCPV